MYCLTIFCVITTASLINLAVLCQSRVSPSNAASSSDCDHTISSEDYQLIEEPKIVITYPSPRNDGSYFPAQPYRLVPLSSITRCPDNLTLSISGFDRKFVIVLVKNKHLISDNYFKVSREHTESQVLSVSDKKLDEKFHKNNLFLNLHNFTSNDDHCHYYVQSSDDFNSAISIVNYQTLSGFFHDKHHVYTLSSHASNSSTILSKHSQGCSPKLGNMAGEVMGARSLKSFRNGLGSTYSRTSTFRLNTSSESRVLHEPYLSNSSSYYVEMLVVHDHSQYIEYEKNTSLIAERTMQIVNIMNAFYRQVNIFISLVGVVLWVEEDEIQLTEDGDSTLTNFLKYRYEKLLPKYHHDNAQLITNTSFNGSVVGKALKGPICTHEHSGGVNTDHSHSPAIVAVTLAHELGHNFGMEHDEDDKCKCPDEKCIMSSSSSNLHPKHWSSCSIDYLEDAKKRGLLDCLTNVPAKTFGPACGNGFVEEGEDCDLGELLPTSGTLKTRTLPSNCQDGTNCEPTHPSSQVNTCCDRRTCKFVTNATCAQGPCCDLSTCSIFKPTEKKTCRPRRGDCDLEEVCDGKSEYCPADVYYHDGIECGPTVSLDGGLHEFWSAEYNRSRAYCYKGKCASHQSQCQLLWGSTGTVSNDLCYEQNIHGNTSGNCGFNRREKLFHDCEPENAICGMLHCIHHQPSTVDSRKTGKLDYGFESASVLTVSFFVMHNNDKIYCHGAIIDAGPGIRDPGMVPNGAACDEDKMCLDQKCVPVYEVVYKDWCPYDCNGNGICDNLGVCHCNDGTIGTSCYQFFGSNFHLSLLLYMVMFFVPVIALIVLTINHYRGKIKIWWFLYKKRIVLRDKARVLAHNKRMPYEVDRDKVTISDPIPLNQHDNINRPFYNPVADPWAETICDDSGKSIINKPPLDQEGTGSLRVALNLHESTMNSAPIRPTRPTRAAPILPSTKR